MKIVMGQVADDCGPRNPGLTQTIEIVANLVQPGGDSVATIAQLQALLDAHPSTVFKVQSFVNIEQHSLTSVAFY